MADISEPFIWDAHSCIPLMLDADLSCLERHRASGARFVHVNVGMDDEPWHYVTRLLHAFAAQLRSRPEQFILASSLDDVSLAVLQGKLAVAFDLEGSNMIGPDVEALRLFHDLGVRQMHLVYNRNNAAGGGCLDYDIGLTAYGANLVRAVNRCGVIMDVSHSSLRTSLDVMSISTRPVVFSHANARALTEHPRNITDEQIKACAATGGVIGVTGISEFLGDPRGRTDSMLRHLDYMVELVGPAHVGIGLDYVYGPMADPSSPYSPPAMKAWAATRRARDVEPEQLPELMAAMQRAGYGEASVRQIAAGNFMRVAAASWPAHD
ncbi:MAG TPA: membrane dipeptidase [Steroidobacteraceae bacterium]|jgi:membrane dipeptidase|nr:membrane dipeptidase [Steroidobacteraceae bacterium]